MSSHQAGFGVELATHSLVAFLLVALFIYFAARFVIDRSGVIAALLTAFLGTLLAGLVLGAVGGTLGVVLAVIVWALVAAFFFRTSWVKGAIIGVVAWLLWWLTRIVVQALT